MERHGSESFFVVGEGLLGETVGGREPRLVGDAAAGAPPFRMGPNGAGRAPTDAARLKIAKAMTEGGGGSSRIPAGYTYLGQFLDHDLTFDKTDVTFGDHISPGELLQGRSPSLDLDSMYGAGPQQKTSRSIRSGAGSP